MTLTTAPLREGIANDLTTRRDSRLRGWKARLDAHITRCPGCDQWCWDGDCKECAR